MPSVAADPEPSPPPTEAKAETLEPPHQQVYRVRAQLEEDIDQFVCSLEAEGVVHEMGTIHALRRVYGIGAFLREFDTVLEIDKLSTPQQTEFNCLCKRWIELEELMFKVAQVQE